MEARSGILDGMQTGLFAGCSATEHQLCMKALDGAVGRAVIPAKRGFRKLRLADGSHILPGFARSATLALRGVGNPRLHRDLLSASQRDQVDQAVYRGDVDPGHKVWSASGGNYEPAQEGDRL